MSMEDLTLRELREATDIMTTLFTSMVQHTLEHLSDADHDCLVDMDGIENDDIPSFDDFDVKVFLAFEDSMVSQMTFIRTVLRSQGYQVTEEVGR